MALLDKLYLCVKYNELQIDITPLLLDKSVMSGFGRAESARRVPGRTARKHWVGERRINQLVISPLIPAFSLKGEGASTCVNTYA